MFPQLWGLPHKPPAWGGMRLHDSSQSGPILKNQMTSCQMCPWCSDVLCSLGQGLWRHRWHAGPSSPEANEKVLQPSEDQSVLPSPVLLLKMWTLQTSGPPTLWASRAGCLHLPALFRNAPNYNLKLPTFYFFPLRAAAEMLTDVWDAWNDRVATERNGWLFVWLFLSIAVKPPHIEGAGGDTRGQLCYCESVSRMSVCLTHNITIIGGTSAEAQDYFDVFKNILK